MRSAVRTPMPPGCLSLVLLAGLLILLPFFLANALLLALGKLGFSPVASLLVALGIFFGGLVNLPVYRFRRDEIVEVRPFGLYGLDWLIPRLVRRRTYTVIAVNMGGCLLPCLVAAYELSRIAAAGLLTAALVAGSVNVLLCYHFARPVPAGIALPPLVPALAAALTALLLARELAPPVAFTAGVLGPLIGADLLHLEDLRRRGVAVASIGGAGTFDGIVVSGLAATLLA